MAKALLATWSYRATLIAFIALGLYFQAVGFMHLGSAAAFRQKNLLDGVAASGPAAREEPAASRAGTAKSTFSYRDNAKHPPWIRSARLTSGREEPVHTRPPPGAAPLWPELANSIRRVSDSESDVDRTLVERFVERPHELLQKVRILHQKTEYDLAIIRLFGIAPNTLLSELGFQNGDALLSVNGFNASALVEALRAYARLRTADDVTVRITRRGEPLSLHLRIR